MLFFGPADFSHGIGRPGQWDAPEIAQARKAVATTARRHGKFAGTVATPDSLRDRLEEGYQFINLGADVLGLVNYFDDLAKAFVNAGFGDTGGAAR